MEKRAAFGDSCLDKLENRCSLFVLDEITFMFAMIVLVIISNAFLMCFAFLKF